MTIERRNRKGYIWWLLGGLLIAGSIFFAASGEGSNRAIESQGINSQMPDPCNDPRVQDPKSTNQWSERKVVEWNPDDKMNYTSLSSEHSTGAKISGKDFVYFKQLIIKHGLNKGAGMFGGDVGLGTLKPSGGTTYQMFSMVAKFYLENCK